MHPFPTRGRRRRRAVRASSLYAPLRMAVAAGRKQYEGGCVGNISSMERLADVQKTNLDVREAPAVRRAADIVGVLRVPPQPRHTLPNDFS